VNKVMADAATAKAAAVAFLRAKLAETGMSQTELAQKSGLERSHVSEMLAGRLARFGMDRVNRALAVFNAHIETKYQFKIQPTRDARETLPDANASSGQTMR
jgi:predicted XRE-type DNA-binding protein